MREKIYDPDGIIDAYSRCLGRNLLEERAHTETTNYQQNQKREPRPTESKSSQLIKKIAVVLYGYFFLLFFLFFPDFLTRISNF